MIGIFLEETKHISHISKKDIVDELRVPACRKLRSSRAVARTLIGGGEGCIFIFSGSARLTSFEINFISKEVSRAEPEYMNIHPPVSVLATALRSSMMHELFHAFVYVLH